MIEDAAHARALAATGADPHRRLADEANAAPGGSRCPACDRGAWADPTLEATALALRGPGDPSDLVAPGGGLDRLSIVLGIGSVAVLLIYAAFALVDGLLGLWLAGVLTIITARTAIHLAVERGRRRAARARRPPAARWHLALPTATRMRDRVEGPIASTGELLRAPISGRPCLAYEVGVRADRQLDAPDHTWLLLEQRTAAFTIGTRRFAADCVRLRLPRVPLPELAPAAVRAFLRSRAFVGDERGLVVTETLVQPGDALQVASDRVTHFGATREIPYASPSTTAA